MLFFFYVCVFCFFFCVFFFCFFFSLPSVISSLIFWSASRALCGVGGRLPTSRGGGIRGEGMQMGAELHARRQAAGLGSARLLPACYTTSPAGRACCQQSPCFPSQRGNPALFPPWWILFFSSGSWTRQQAPRGRAVPGARGVQSLALLSLRFLLLVRRASALPAPGAAFPAELRLRAFARPVYF